MDRPRPNDAPPPSTGPPPAEDTPPANAPADAASRSDTAADAPGALASGPPRLRPPQAADETGRLGGYRVLKMLGQGGMGAVYLAEDTRLRRRVALKVMRPKVGSNVQARERFLREATLAAALEHDHVVP